MIRLAFGILTIVIIALNGCNTYTQGERLYQLHCANCHGNNGEGLVKLYPSLQGSDFLADSLRRLPCIIKLGKVSYDSSGMKNAEMPAITDLNEAQLINLINYVHHTFNNQPTYLHPDSILHWSAECR